MKDLHGEGIGWQPIGLKHSGKWIMSVDALVACTLVRTFFIFLTFLSVNLLD